MKNHLKASKSYFKEVYRCWNLGKTLIEFISQINGDEFVEKVHDEVTQAIKEFIQHVEKRA